MSAIGLVWHQFRFDRKRFLRDPAGLFYGVGFPAIFLVVFLATLGGNEEVGHIAGHALESKTYYLAAIVAMSVVSATFVNLAVSLTSARERGTLKRVRGTPLPTWAFMAGRLATAITVTLGIVVLVVVVGRLAYGVDVPTGTLPGALLALVIGTAAFCALAFAITALMPTANTAAAVSMTLTLVLYFISGIFTRNDNVPTALQHVADVFPIKRLFESMAVAFDPATTGPAVRVSDLLIVAAWGIGGFLIALRFFRWGPAGG